MQSGNNCNDRELFRKVKSGDKQSFAEFIRRYQQKIFNFCYSFFLEHARAEDMMQETFIKFYQSLGRIRQLEKFESYLFQIARNLCRDYIRKKKEVLVSPVKDDHDSQAVTIEKLSGPDNRNPENLFISMEDEQYRAKQVARLHDRMKDLDQNQRTAIYLVHFEGMPYGKAAEILNCPEGTVKSRVNRGIAALSEMFMNNRAIQQQELIL